MERIRINDSDDAVLPVSVPPHAQQSGESLEEEALYPRGHWVVGSRRAVVDVDDEDGDNDGKGDKDHDKEQIFSNQWDHLETDKGNGYRTAVIVSYFSLNFCSN